ncbi:hypothetical protein Tco_1038260 [Tanacetum coccineum]
MKRLVEGLSKQINDLKLQCSRAERLSQWEAWVRSCIPERLRFQEEPPTPSTFAPRANDPYVMARDASMAAQEDDDDDVAAAKDPQPSESRGSPCDQLFVHIITLPSKRRSRTNPQPTLTKEAADQLVREGIEVVIRAERERVREEANRARGRAGGPAAAPVVRECTFAGFMKCGPTDNRNNNNNRNKRGNYRGNNQYNQRRQDGARAMTAAQNNVADQGGPAPKCNRCGLCHFGNCPAKMGHKACYECGDRNHDRSPCPKLADRRGGNATGHAYALRDAEQGQGPNVVTVKHDALIVCGKKEVHIPVKGKMLLVKGNCDESRLKVITAKLYGTTYKGDGMESISEYIKYYPPPERGDKYLDGMLMFLETGSIFPTREKKKKKVYLDDDAFDICDGNLIINFLEYFANRPNGGSGYSKLKGKDGYLNLYYVALKYAVEAALEVVFVATSKETKVFGRVMAYYGKNFSYGCCASERYLYNAMLFETKQPSHIEPGKINLMRSALGVPAQYSLIIDAKLHDFTSGDMILSGVCEFFVPIDGSSSVGFINGNDCSLKLKVDWKLPI